MTADRIIEALGIPGEALVNRKVAKKLLTENGAPTAGDKKVINEGVEELVWIAAIKPTSVGVVGYKDATREVAELAVMRARLRADAKASRLVELIHRAIPYPVFLVTEQSESTTISLATKRWAQNEGGKTVLDDALVSCAVNDGELAEKMLEALSIGRQNRINLNELYRGWIAVIEAYQAALITGSFSLAGTEEAREWRRAALGDHDRLERELVNLRAEAKRETQMNRRVELNLAIKKREAELSEARKRV